MILYINGDSNIAGTELTDLNRSISNHLAKRLGGASIDSQAMAGASNDYIYDSTMRKLVDIEWDKPTLKYRPDLVVIGWTDFGRVQWFLDDGIFREANRLGVWNLELPEKYQSRHEWWKKNYAFDGTHHRIISRYWQTKIYNVHLMLEYFKIPHVFFNTFQSFFEHEPGIEWAHHYIGSHDKSLNYVNWCQNHGYQEITPGYLHFPEEAQEAYADMLYAHILEHKII